MQNYSNSFCCYFVIISNAKIQQNSKRTIKNGFILHFFETLFDFTGKHYRYFI